MVWGYSFADIEEHLLALGYVRVRIIDGIVLFRRGDAIFTIRGPNLDGMLPETIVVDAFDNAGMEPPPPATRYVD